MRINQAQIEAVLALPGPRRYAHFIKVAADQGCVWGLYADGWALAGSDEGGAVFPLWPAAEYAGLCAVAEWSGYEPRQIDLDDLLENLLPSLRERDTGLGIFYTPDDKGVLPTLDQFEHDLRDELAKLE
jgi:hypothetical protein